MSAWWDVLGALALSVPLYSASSRAGHRWARWRDLRRQEREIDRAARAIPDEERFGDWRGPVARAKPLPHPNITPPTEGSGQAAARHRERQNEAAIRAGRGVVSLEVPPLAPTPTVRNGRAASIVPLILSPDDHADLDDLVKAHGFIEVRNAYDEIVRLDNSPADDDFDDWGSSEGQNWG